MSGTMRSSQSPSIAFMLVVAAALADLAALCRAIPGRHLTVRQMVPSINHRYINSLVLLRAARYRAGKRMGSFDAKKFAVLPGSRGIGRAGVCRHPKS